MRRKKVYIRPVQLYLYSRYDVQRGGRLNPTDVSSVKKKENVTNAHAETRYTITPLL